MQQDDMPVLVHHSHEPLPQIRPTSFIQRACVKPAGLWVATDDDQGWKAWCERGNFALDGLRFTHDIIIAKDAKILRLDGHFDIMSFTNKYRAPLYGTSTIEKSSYLKGIDWRRVASEYQGILIIPYVWSCRLQHETFWYYGWDCASGCIWDTSVIEKVSIRETA